MNVRSALEYVPYFCGRLFVVHVAAGLLRAEELVDALLDADALHAVGVRLVLVAEGEDSSLLARQAGVCEVHTAVAEMPLTAGAVAVSRVQEIVERRQVAIVASGAPGLFDAATVSMAQTLGADKYICLLDGDVPTRAGQPVYAVLESEIEQCMQDCTHPELLAQAAQTCRLGIPRIHLLDGRHRGVLLDELFSEEGVGTMVHGDSYREIRPLREEDIPELLSMIARSMADAKLVHRTYESICENLQSYYVYTLDDTIVGCVALYPYPDEQCAELGCLFIKKNYEGRGYGKAMCRFVENKAREQGFSRIFAISQSAVDYFRDRMHYDPLPRSVLPAPRREMLESSGRTSGVFGREL